jgi:hypothetical protein
MEAKQFALLAALPARKLIKTIGLAILLLDVSSALIGASKASHSQSNNARSNIETTESTDQKPKGLPNLRLMKMGGKSCWYPSDRLLFRATHPGAI